jgi:hypothetical protein
MKKLLLTATGLMLASASTHACDLDLTRSKPWTNKLHMKVTCGAEVIEDSNINLTSKDKSNTCIVYITGVQQLEQNVYLVESKCDITSTLMFKLVGDTLQIRDAENY